jgi:hypothetical protein
MSVTKIYPDPNFWLEPTSSTGSIPVYGASGIVTLFNNIISARNDAGDKLTKVDTDPFLTQNSDTNLASEKAIKAYVDAHTSGGITDPISMNFITQSSTTAMGSDILNIHTKDASSGLKWILQNDFANISFSMDTTGAPIFDSSDGTFTISPTTQTYFSNPLASTSSTTGAVTIAGGLGLLGRINSGGLTAKGVANHLTLEYPLSSHTAKITTNNLGDIILTSDTKVTSNPRVEVLNTTTTTGTLDGCALFMGGVDIEDNLYVKNTITPGALATVPILTATDYVSSQTGVYLGKRIYGGTWWKCYQLALATNDAVAMSLITKDVDTSEVCRKKVNVSTEIGVYSAVFSHSIESGPTANQPRICTFASVTSNESPEYYSMNGVGGLGNINTPWQSFISITGKPLSSTTIYAAISNLPWVCDLYTGEGLGGTLLATSGQANSVPSTFTFSPTVALTVGNKYTLAFRPIGAPATYTWGIVNLSDMPGCNFGIGGTLTGYNSRIIIRVMNTYDSSWDIYVYGQPEVNSLTDVKIEAANNAPVWVNEGTGTWPSTHSTGANIRIDTDTYVPNMSFEMGAMTLNTSLKMTATVTKIDTDTALTADSAAYLPTQHAVKTYVDTRIPSISGTVPVNYSAGSISLKNNAASPATITAIDIDTSLAGDSATSIPTQHAVKSYVDTHGSSVSVSIPLKLTGGVISIMNNAGSPAAVTKVDVDTTLVGDSNAAIPTQHAVKTYIDTKVPSFVWGTITIGSGSGPFNDVALSSSSATWFHLNNSANSGSHITGIAGGTDGRFICIVYNTYPSSGNVINLDQDSASSSAANRILSPTGGSINMNPNPTAVVTMIYDGTVSRWCVIGIQP